MPALEKKSVKHIKEAWGVNFLRKYVENIALYGSSRVLI